ncbi:DMT family transporter [Lutimaribacter sp. EGI FJ00015]|uniref:DMT family transporter n=1 Tax=Lutimaribacter degradans TaxID=2945989 RepID=A0ACC5ZZB1_9RHOB|nr:DMT family transporter [Lutimaribacter sp. EGI FJ00013]MCM2563677.1 DMT family transporter [Lutimaribacter sp. EGI FJ00013]MCO0614861.1 DMT family transporter [Lutimaribacter sp. EGI FJ00015]MCO0637529.1 DMT family transporter [Lutimaribacter sp. EGI FJ00014]
MTNVTTPNDDSLLWRLAPVIFVLFWAGGYSFAKLGLPHIRPMTLLALRYGLAVLVLLPLLLFYRPQWPRGGRHWGVIALSGFMIQCLYFGGAYVAMQNGMNAGTTALIMALQPILVAALAPMVGASRGSRRLWSGLVLGLLGVLIVILGGKTIGPSPWVAVPFAIAALLAITFATLFEKWHGRRTDPVIGGIVQYAVGFVVMAPIALSFGLGSVNWTGDLFISLAYLVLANSIVSISLYVGLVQRGDATRISSLMYLVPPLAMLLAWAILGEIMTPMAMAGMAVCVTGVWLVNRAGRTA